MDNTRNRIIKLVDYIESKGVIVNIGKNKARGNKGFFIKKSGECFRIDISKELPDVNIVSTLLHEFAHFLHYKYDNSLKSLNFAFEDLNDAEYEELLAVTVENVPKDFAQNLYKQKDDCAKEIKTLSDKIRAEYSDFKISQPQRTIEKKLPLYAKYLLKYDRVKVLNRIYTIDNFADGNDVSKAYLKLKSAQRLQKRISSKINKLNRYYSQPCELWARFFELYFADINRLEVIAPNLCKKFQTIVAKGCLSEILELEKILQI